MTERFIQLVSKAGATKYYTEFALLYEFKLIRASDRSYNTMSGQQRHLPLRSILLHTRRTPLQYCRIRRRVPGFGRRLPLPKIWPIASCPKSYYMYIQQFHENSSIIFREICRQTDRWTSRQTNEGKIITNKADHYHNSSRSFQSCTYIGIRLTNQIQCTPEFVHTVSPHPDTRLHLSDTRTYAYV